MHVKEEGRRGRRKMEDGKKEGGRSMEGGKGGTFLWSLGSMGVPWELSSGAWGLLGGPWGFLGRGWELSSGAWELSGGPWEFQGCSLGTPGGCLGALGLSQGDDGKRLVACGERLKLAPSPQGESREGSGEGVGTVQGVVCQFLGDLFDHICLFFLLNCT